jgi:hypothetical protein
MTFQDIIDKLNATTEFTLDVSVWLRSEGYHLSFLLRAKDYKQCCIGQFCSKAGIPVNELLERKTVMQLGVSERTLGGLSETGPTYSDDISSAAAECNTIIHALYCINDVENVSDEDKLPWIVEGFRAAGITCRVKGVTE